MKLLENLTMTSKEIAQLCRKEHKHVLRDIREYLIDTGIWQSKDGQRGNCSGFRTSDKVLFNLPKREALILVSGYNVEVRTRIIDRWLELEKLFADRKTLASEYLPMTNAIQTKLLDEGKEIKFYHYSNEADLINRIALGYTASGFRKQNSIPETDSIRDYLTTEQAKCLLSLQRANTVYIEEGLGFEDRKVRLSSLYNVKFKNKLIQEIHKLQA